MYIIHLSSLLISLDTWIIAIQNNYVFYVNWILSLFYTTDKIYKCNPIVYIYVIILHICQICKLKFYIIYDNSILLTNNLLKL